MNMLLLSELISTSQQERIPRNLSLIHLMYMDRRGSKEHNRADIPTWLLGQKVICLKLHADTQKMKRLPTPSSMNDYYAASPRIFPHLCSLCNVECSHLKVSVFKDHCIMITSAQVSSKFSYVCWC